MCRTCSVSTKACLTWYTGSIVYIGVATAPDNLNSWQAQPGNLRKTTATHGRPPLPWNPWSSEQEIVSFGTSKRRAASQTRAGVGLESFASSVLPTPRREHGVPSPNFACVRGDPHVLCNFEAARCKLRLLGKSSGGIWHFHRAGSSLAPTIQGMQSCGIRLSLPCLRRSTNFGSMKVAQGDVIGVLRQGNTLIFSASAGRTVVDRTSEGTDHGVFQVRQFCNFLAMS